ncbi:NADH dehydrogenase [ubiquinone] flavoprotein 3, mitochondrial isoform X2 [Echeneis naucrates]|uniref:NADH dehydrogenase [ubiquinone] flavoprotein 3, mitochondrial isoform X2 n=1 Tax=Echeneis naucrates TaxID=173247 RepID=UPI00111419D5|nr:NADH dehydrogenase [ubiquinone] flavoprotein 3, mitochondrial isoform X2 [Echeneis naucrates]
MGKGTSHLSQSSDLQHLQVECWDILRCSAAPLCTQAEGSPKEMNTASKNPAAVQSDEPFDSSTYKNYQHHNYTPYTFADLDVEMAKFRLPQPSSGRPSPRH